MPDNHNAICANDNKGKPMCVVGADCFQCERDADCVNFIGSPLARCIKKCATCNDAFAKTLCVMPLTVAGLP
ncbi:MAG TPA: hypothetical protein VFU81_17170 [Thermomicrobiales bacterium]|nr:hypothetical protein [Thermomicrobiales bacterium]